MRYFIEVGIRTFILNILKLKSGQGLPGDPAPAVTTKMGITVSWKLVWANREIFGLFRKSESPRILKNLFDFST